jgi:hypothetical protein
MIYIERLRAMLRQLPWQPPLMVAGVGLALAGEPLFQPRVFDDYGYAQVANAVSRQFVENLIVGLALLASIAWTRRKPVASAWVESARLLAAVCVSTAGANLCLAIADFGLTSGVWVPFAIGETVRWAVLGSFLALVDAFRQRRQRAGARAREVIVAQAALRAQTEVAQMQLLEAQIEPHFLFNTIANLRRTWNVDPALGLRMHDNLLVYLRAALPQMRSAVGALGEEAALVRAYLELFSLRMGERLAFAIDVPGPLVALPFPRMMLITLTENAIRHGLMPSDHGGTVRIQACAEHGQLVVSVVDDGVGFGVAKTGGTGVGLANIRARLATQYGSTARLLIESATAGSTPRGVRVSIRLPLAGAPSHGGPAPAAARSANVSAPADPGINEERHVLS